MCRSREQGQTLVELAIVLPLFCLGVFTTVHLGRVIHDAVEIQRMASVAAASVSLENYRGTRSYYWLNSLIGDFSVPKISCTSEVVGGWRPFRGIATLKTHGRIVKATVGTTLFPGEGFTRVLPRVRYSASAETLLEPAVPEEKQ
jgi:hypothetical protein